MILFNQRGYEAVGVSELCNEIGITPTSLYAAFGNKYGLFERVIEAYVAGPANFVGTALASAKTVDKAIEAVLKAAAIAYTEDEKRPGCLVLDCELKVEQTAALELIAAKAKATQAVISARLQKLGAADPQAMALFVMTIMRGLSAASRTGSGRADLFKVIELAMQGVGSGVE
ncbi:MAG: TetR/AcrR family transcriptional regulator [Cyanobacteria bacterium P01_G01_bin.38]